MARRQAKRASGAPNWVAVAFALGLVCGLGLATLIGLVGSNNDPSPPTGVAQQDSGAPQEEIAPPRRYEFFSVLPEVERVVPEREMAERVATADAEPQRQYRLQAGSFRDNADAETLKAEITLLGLSAEVQSVTVDDKTWHRVRVGPYDSARQADGARRRLQDNGLEALVLTEG